MMEEITPTPTELTPSQSRANYKKLVTQEATLRARETSIKDKIKEITKRERAIVLDRNKSQANLAEDPTRNKEHAQKLNFLNTEEESLQERRAKLEAQREETMKELKRAEEEVEKADKEQEGREKAGEGERERMNASIKRAQGNSEGAYVSSGTGEMGWRNDIPEKVITEYLQKGGTRAVAHSMAQTGKVEGALGAICQPIRDNKMEGVRVPIQLLSSLKELRTITGTTGTGIGQMASAEIEGVLRPPNAIDELGIKMQVVANGEQLPTRLTDGRTINRGMVREGVAATQNQLSVTGQVLTAQRFHEIESISGKAEHVIRGLQGAVIEDLMKTLMLTKCWEFLFAGIADITNDRNIKGSLLNRDNIVIVSIGTNGGALTLNHLQDLQAAVHNNNADVRSCKWVMDHATFAKAQRLSWTEESGGGSIITQHKDGKGGGPWYLLGREVVLTSQIPSSLTKGTGTGLSAIMYLDVSKIQYAEFMGYDILIDPYSSATKNEKTIHLVSFADMLTNFPTVMGAIKDIQ